jgi:dihydropteroate synthase
VIARSLPLHSPRAVAEALRARGMNGGRADAAAGGMTAAAVELLGLTPETVIALVRQAGPLGLEVVTGADWAIIGGSEARLSALARSWALPEPLAEVARQVGVLLPPDPAAVWVTARGPIPLDHPVILGILNLTPDSFSDGGRFLSPEAALAQADRLLADGAAVLDLGGESTRPGSEEIPESEELSRVIPVLEALVRRHPGVPLSVDTVKSGVAARALEAGAAIVNDVSALRLDPAIGPVAARGGAGVVLMHSRGTVSTMARLDDAEYTPDVVTQVRAELRASLDGALAAGIGVDHIVLDPGFGFAKTAEQNLVLCDRLRALLSLGRPLLVGPSRKRFLGSVTGRDIVERDVATAAACVVLYERGARLFRVHNVAATRDALAVADAVRGASN